MIIHNVQQNTPEWNAVRCGVPTASSFDMIICSDGKPSKQRQKYLYRLAGERVTGKVEETYTNGAMQRGHELEDEARKLYEMYANIEVAQVGFCENESPRFGASPDGLVGEDGLLEIKCPMITTHVGYLLDNVLPTEYFQQTQGQLLVTGRKWVDFMSYYPGSIKPLLIRVLPNNKFQDALKAELGKFCKELDDIVNKLKQEA